MHFGFCRNLSTSSASSVYTKLAPKDPYTFTVTTASYIYPIYMVLAFTSFVQFLLIRLVTEKEQKLKQGMEIMGLKDTAYWFGWFLTYAVIIFVFSFVAIWMGSVSIWRHRFLIYY